MRTFLLACVLLAAPQPVPATESEAGAVPVLACRGWRIEHGALADLATKLDDIVTEIRKLPADEPGRARLDDVANAIGTLTDLSRAVTDASAPALGLVCPAGR